MIISENCETLMKISHFFRQSLIYHVDIVHSSAAAVEAFMETRPEFVILDSETLIPYRTMLRFFREYDPGCRCLLVMGTSDGEETVPCSSVRYLLKSDLSRETVLDILEQFRTKTTAETPLISRELSIPFGSPGLLRLYQDTYCLLLGTYIERGCPHEKLYYNVRRIGSEMQKNEALDAVLYNDLDVLVAFRSSSRPHSSQILRHMHRLTDIQYPDASCYAVFSMEQVAWNEFEESVEHLCNCAPLSYFFPGQMISYTHLQQSSRCVHLSVLDFYCEKVLVSLIHAREEEAEKALEHALYNYIKPNLDLTAASYFREKLWRLLRLLPGNNSSEILSLEESAPTLADEHIRMKTCLSAVSVLLQRRELSRITVQALQYVLENRNDDISLSTAAENISISPAHLSHVFKKDMAVTFVEFVQSCKLTDAMLQLRYTERKVYEIANAVGYRDAQYFSRIMKKRTGLSPEQYRQGRKEARNESLI